VKDAAVFLLRAIIHNWPTTSARKILRQLANAAVPSTRVVLVDIVLPYATQGNAVPLANNIPGVGRPQLPSPLLTSAGKERSYDMDITARFARCQASFQTDDTERYQMLSALMAQERTLDDHLQLLEGTGWKLAEIIPTTPGAPSHLVLVLDG
jgi:hypothetical protein